MSPLESAKQVILAGGVIAYPTEAVYGLGCDPFNEDAVLKLLQLKNREINKGLILIASRWQQLKPLVEELPSERMDAIWKTWPGPYTWIIPASKNIPVWIRGDHTTIAVRVTAHPIAKALSELCEMPLVSTSANRSQLPPAKDPSSVRQQFNDKIDFIIDGPLGQQATPTTICDGLTGKIIRE